MHSEKSLLKQLLPFRTWEKESLKVVKETTLFSEMTIILNTYLFEIKVFLKIFIKMAKWEETIYFNNLNS